MVHSDGRVETRHASNPYQGRSVKDFDNFLIFGQMMIVFLLFHVFAKVFFAVILKSHR